MPIADNGHDAVRVFEYLAAPVGLDYYAAGATNSRHSLADVPRQYIISHRNIATRHRVRCAFARPHVGDFPIVSVEISPRSKVELYRVAKVASVAE